MLYIKPMLRKFLKYFLLYISYLCLCHSSYEPNITVWTNAGDYLNSTTSFLDLPIKHLKSFESGCSLLIFNTKSTGNSSQVIKSYLQDHINHTYYSNWTYQPEKEIKWQDLIEAWEKKAHKKLEKLNDLNSNCSSEKIQFMDLSSNNKSLEFLNHFLTYSTSYPYLLMFFPFFNKSNIASPRQLQITSTTTTSSPDSATKAYISIKPTSIPIIIVALITFALTVLAFILLTAIDTPAFFLKTVPPVNKEF